MHINPDEWRLCACGVHVGVWRSRDRLSLSHKLPLCPAYDAVGESGGGEAYLAAHTTVLVNLTEEPLQN